MPSSPKETNTRLTPASISASAANSEVDSPVMLFASYSLGLKALSLLSTGFRRSAFATDTGSAYSGAVTLSAIHESVSLVRFPSMTTASAAFISRRCALRYSAVMLPDMSVSQTPTSISPFSSVTYR